MAKTIIAKRYKYNGWAIVVDARGAAYVVRDGERVVGPFSHQSNAEVWIDLNRKAA